jgi:hypothetical protein
MPKCFRTVVSGKHLEEASWLTSGFCSGIHLVGLNITSVIIGNHAEIRTGCLCKSYDALNHVPNKTTVIRREPFTFYLERFRGSEGQFHGLERVFCCFLKTIKDIMKLEKAFVIFFFLYKLTP